MKINGKTKISKLIKENKEAIEVIASLNPHFTKLRNPVLRKMLAPRVNISEAARIGKCEVQVMLDKLVEIGFEIDTEQPIGEDTIDQAKQIEEKERFIAGKKLFEFDVRPYLEKGDDPLKTIQQTIKKLTPDDVLEIIINFEPVPLIRIQERNGFEALTIIEDDIYHTYFKMGKEVKDYSKVASDIKSLYTELSEDDFQAKLTQFSGELVELDVRNLEMPQPMMKILETIEEIEGDQGINVQHKRIPQFLLPELKPYNLDVFTHTVGEGDVKLLILPKNV